MTAPTRHQPHCPFCLSAIRPEDDSVVCSACGIPHHRECWRLNRKCTTYGCVGQPTSPASQAPEPPPIEVTLDGGSVRGRVQTSQWPWRQWQDASPRAPQALRPGPPFHPALIVWLVACLVAVALIGRQAVQPIVDPPLPRATGVELAPRILAPPPPQTRAWRTIKRPCGLQAAPDITSQVLLDLRSGDLVEVLADNGPWMYVRFSSAVNGYVPRIDLALTDSGPPPGGRQ